MKRSLILGFLVAAILLVSISNLAWWYISVPAVVSGIFQIGFRRSFVDSFAAGFLVWFGAALAQDASAGFRISQRVAGVFHLPLSPLALVMTGLIAGLVAGVSAMCGQSVVLVIRRQT
jgi:hypothetical protein